MARKRSEGHEGWDEYAPFYDWENARTLGRRDEAELLFRRALAINEKVLGPDHATVAASAGSLGALYREFNQDEKAALKRYAGRRLVLEGRQGTLIPLDSGGAAIHIGDGFTSRALVLVFGSLKEVSGIGEGDLDQRPAAGVVLPGDGERYDERPERDEPDH